MLAYCAYRYTVEKAIGIPWILKIAASPFFNGPEMEHLFGPMYIII